MSDAQTYVLCFAAGVCAGVLGLKLHLRLNYLRATKRLEEAGWRMEDKPGVPPPEDSGAKRPPD